MKARLSIAAALMALSATALAQMGPGTMGGPGPGASGGCAFGAGDAGGRTMHRHGGMGRGIGVPNDMSWHHLDLSAEQRAKITEVQRDIGRKQWALMGTMHDQRYEMNALYARGNPDEAALRKAYDAMADARKQMFEISLEARRRIDAVLTPEQRERVSRGPVGR